MRSSDLLCITHISQKNAVFTKITLPELTELNMTAARVASPNCGSLGMFPDMQGDTIFKSLVFSTADTCLILFILARVNPLIKQPAHLIAGFSCHCKEMLLATVPVFHTPIFAAVFRAICVMCRNNPCPSDNLYGLSFGLAPRISTSVNGVASFGIDNFLILRWLLQTETPGD
jgi:hypothetical protein